MKKETPTLVTVVISVLITSIFWVAFGVISSLRKETSLDLDERILKPISPSLNQKILDKLETRTFFEDVEEIIISTESSQIVVP